MELQELTITFVGLTFLLYMGIAYQTRAKTTKEFYVAGGGIGPIGNGMATAADWMSAASLSLWLDLSLFTDTVDLYSY